MKKAVVVALAIGLTSALAGCNGKGTCVNADKDGSPGLCWVDYSKRACGEMGGQYFDEAGTAGVLHCKSLGYEKYVAGGGPATAEEALKKGEAAAFAKPFRPSAK